jgi:hypothetical protein
MVIKFQSSYLAAPVLGGVFSPVHRKLIAFNGASSNNLIIWSVITADETPLVGHSSGIVDVILVSDFSFLISYDAAGKIIFWENFVVKYTFLVKIIIFLF